MKREAIFYEDGDTTTNCDELRYLMADALEDCLPDEILSDVFREVFFICERENDASYWSSETLSGRPVIVFDRAIFDVPIQEARRTILHEIAHHVLGHHVVPYMETPEEHEEHETEAWNLVDNWLGKQ